VQKLAKDSGNDEQMTPPGRKIRAVMAAEEAAGTVSARTAESSDAVKQDLKETVHSISEGAIDAVANVNMKLKSVGVATDAMVSAAKNRR
jgi:hypothetical protein